MLRVVFVFFFLISVLPCTSAVFAEELKAAFHAGITGGEVLDLERCLEIALRMQPNIRAAKGQTAASQSRVGQAESAYYPEVDLSAGYGANHPASNTGTTSRGFDRFSNSVTLSQNIYDFGRRPSQVRIQELNTDAFRSDLRNTMSIAAFNVKQSYYALLQAKKNMEVASETVTQFEKHLEEAKGFFEVGLRPRFDVTRAEVDLSNAKVNLIRAENAIRLSKIALKNAMGVPEAPDFEILDDFKVDKVGISLEEATARAFQARPDLGALSARRRSVEESITFARSGYYPFITGNADYNWGGESYPFEDGWSAEVTLTLPLFNGFLTKHRVQESKANLEVAGANEDILRQSVIFEVQQAHSNLRETLERIPAAELALRQAGENLEIANGRYSAGVGSPIEVTDAAVAYINSKTAYIQAVTDYKIARASLERAMGE